MFYGVVRYAVNDLVFQGTQSCSGVATVAIFLPPNSTQSPFVHCGVYLYLEEAIVKPAFGRQGLLKE